MVIADSLLLYPPDCLLAPASVLPDRDSRNIAHGVGYKPDKREAAQHIGTQSSIVGIKSHGRSIELRSMLELAAYSEFEFNPLIIDVREQYPLYDDAKIKCLLERGKDIPKYMKRAIDVMLTWKFPDEDALRYQGISIKYVNEAKEKKVRLRHNWETARCASTGWSWGILTEQKLSKTRMMAQMFARNHIRRSNLKDYRDNVPEFSRVLYALRPRVTLERTMDAAAKDFGCSIDDAYRLFIFSLVTGHSRIDWEKPLGYDEKVVLIGKVGRLRK